MSALARASGPLPTALGNAISDAIHAALVSGMEVDEACSVALAVVGDYWRHAYPIDDATLAAFGHILRRTQP